MKNRYIGAYLVGTFMLAYVMWGIIILAQELGWFQYGDPISYIPVILGANSPAIVTYFIRRKIEPGFTLKQYLIKESFFFKQKPLHYVMAVLFIAIFFGVPAIMGGISPQLEPFAGGTEATAHVPIYLTAIAIPLFFFVGGSEELGWRCFLQPVLEKKMPFVPATIVTGFIWYIWHFPLFFIVGTSQNSSDLISFALYMVGTTFALAAIYRVSKSAWLCVFFHSATNALQGTWPLIDDYFMKGATSAALLIATAIVLYINSKYSSKISKGQGVSL